MKWNSIWWSLSDIMIYDCRWHLPYILRCNVTRYRKISPISFFATLMSLSHTVPVYLSLIISITLYLSIYLSLFLSLYLSTYLYSPRMLVYLSIYMISWYWMWCDVLFFISIQYLSISVTAALYSNAAVTDIDKYCMLIKNKTSHHIQYQDII